MNARGVNMSAFDIELARLSRLYFTDRYVNDSRNPNRMMPKLRSFFNPSSE